MPKLLAALFLVLTFPAAAAPAARFHIAIPETVSRGVAVEFEVWALDASHQIVTDYAGTVHFTANTPGLVLPPDYIFVPADQGKHTFTLTASRAGNAWINVWDGSAGDSAEFSVACPELVVALTNDGPVCQGLGTTLHASATLPDLTFRWQHLPGNMRPQTGPTYVNAEAGLWKVYASAPNGCTAEATTFVEIYAPLAPVFAGPRSICGTTATVTLQNASSFTSLDWTAENATITGGQGTSTVQLTATPGATVMYARLGAKSATGGCAIAPNVFSILMNGAASATADGTFTTCEDADISVPVTLTGTAPFRVVWSDGVVQENIATTSATRTFSASESGTYWIAQVSDATCTAAGTGLVNVIRPEAPEITDQPDSTTIAPAQTATLTVAASGDDVHFRWYEGAAGDRSKLLAVQLSPSFTTPKLARTTQYWVEAMNACDSAGSQTATVTVAAGKRRAARH